MFFAERGEDEVLPGYRQEAQLGLCPLRYSLAEHPARTDRNLGLDRLITLSLRIAFGVHETYPPGLLVFRQEMVSDRNHQHRYSRNGRAVLPSQPGDEPTREQDR